MVVALGIVSAVLIGSLDGIFIAEMMYGGPSAPSRLLTDWADWVVRKLT